MEYVGYYNGEIGPLSEMKIPMLDRSVFFGDSCYEMANFHNKRAFVLHDHINRFYNSCKILGIDFQLTREELVEEIQKCIDANELEIGLLYWQASRGTMMRSFAYGDKKPAANLIMYTAPGALLPQTKTYSLKSYEDIRFLRCNVKTTNLIPAVLYSQESYENGCEESILHRGERVTECGHSNVIILKDGVLKAPPKDNLILPGVTMSNILVLAEKNGIPVKVAPFTMDELRDADEVIITSTGVPCIQGTMLDGRPVGGRDEKTLKHLQKIYMDFYYENVDRAELLDEAHYAQ
mgnify:FL=1